MGYAIVSRWPDKNINTLELLLYQEIILRGDLQKAAIYRNSLLENHYINSTLTKYWNYRNILSPPLKAGRYIDGIDNLIVQLNAEAPNSKASEFALSVFPNPFNPSTTIRFNLINAGIVKVRVYDVQGREVETLINEYLPAGTHRVVWNGSMQASGVYFIRMEAADFVQTGKMYLLK